MDKLIIFELKKLFKTKSFYICIAVSVILIFMNTLLTKTFADASEVAIDPNANTLKFVSNGMLSMIIGIFTAIFVTDDYSCGTMKNIYAKGYSRNEVYLAKYISSTISACCFLFIALITGFLASNSLLNGEVEQNNTFVLSIILQFIVVLAYNSIFFVLSMVIGKLGSSVAFCIVGPSVITLVLNLADSFLKNDKFSFSDYWLDSCLSSLQVINCGQSVIITSFVVSVVVVVAAAFIGLELNSRKEF